MLTYILASIWHKIWHCIWESSWHLALHSICHLIWHIFNIFWHNLTYILTCYLAFYRTYILFWHSIWHSVRVRWGPAGELAMYFIGHMLYEDGKQAIDDDLASGVCVWNICTDEKLLLGRWRFLIWTRSAGVGIYDVAYNQGPRPTKLPDCMGYRAWSALRTCFNFSIVYGDRLSQEPDQDLFILQSLLAYGDRLSRLIHLGLLFSWLICTLKDSVPDGCLKRSNFV